MGTSSSFKGVGKGKPAIPSWAEPGPGNGNQTNNPDIPPAQPDENVLPDNDQEPTPDNLPRVDLSQTRTNITRYVRNNRDQRYLRRAVSSYVQRGLGGSRNAAVRMAVPRAAAVRLYSVVQEAVISGKEAVLRRFHLDDLRDLGLQSIFTALAEFVCTPTSGLDEVIARRAYLQTVEMFPSLGIDDQGEVTADAARDILLTFITETIFTRLIVDTGEGIRKYVQDAGDIIRIEQDIHDYIQGCIQQRLQNEVERLEAIDQQELEIHMQEVYEIAFEILQVEEEDN